MADRSAAPAHNPELLVDVQGPPPLHSTGGSNPAQPFTPRSSTFPDDLSDDDQTFDTFEPTPLSSPGGPRYEDLPPSYDEAQQQALEDARAGRTPPSIDELHVHRLVLNDSHPPPPDGQRTSLVNNPAAYEFEPENRRNAIGLGTSIPIQHVECSERISVGAIPTIPDATEALLSRALEFTRHEPDADVRFAPRLARVVAIPQQGIPALPAFGGRECSQGRGRRRGRGRRELGRGGPSTLPQWGPALTEMHHVPGQWPDSSTENLPESAGEPIQFLRAYAKALHAHSIRPAEFTEFLDGLNALCLATGTTAYNLTAPGSEFYESSSLVHKYIAATNESFFAPRGLKVSFKSLDALVSALEIPDARGQRLGAVASALDDKGTDEQRAGSLYPWIEKTETNVPAPSSQMLVLREMSERLFSQDFPKPNTQTPQNQPAGRCDGATTTGKQNEAEREAQDPDYSIPDEAPGPIPGAFPWVPPNSHGGPFGPGRGPFGPVGNGPFGPPGYGPFGPPGNGPHGPGNWGHWTQNQGNWGGQWGKDRGYEGRARLGRGCGGRRCDAESNPSDGHPFPRTGDANAWAAWGQSIGRLGEEFGKHMQEWGEQFGKNAGQWGQELGRSLSGNAGSSGQQSGVVRNLNVKDSVKASKKDDVLHQGDHDSDTSSISSSDSDSSDSDSDLDEESEHETSYPDPHAIFLARVREINLAAEASTAKGKKSPAVIAKERELAIEEASTEKTALERKIEQKKEKAAKKRCLKEQEREIIREARRVKKEMISLGVDKKEVKKEYRKMKWEAKKEYRKLKWEKKKEHRAKKWEAKKESRAKRAELREERRRLRRERYGGEREVLMDKNRERRMIWVVVENLVA